MGNQLGVDMTYLRPHERETLMRGMALRRLRRTLTETQLGVGIGEDFNAISKKFHTFDFEKYTGEDFETFVGRMIDDGLVVKTVTPGEPKETPEGEKEEAEDKVEYGPGPKVEEFDNSLSDDMEWFIDRLPMSTRGMFDNLVNTPTRKETVDINDFIAAHDNRVVEDTRGEGKSKKNHINDHGLRAGPTGKK